MRSSSWLPAAAWTAVILTLSSDAFGATPTGALLDPWLDWLLPDASPLQRAAAHAALRKGAHVAEYAVLALLCRRALRRNTALAPAGLAATVLALCAGVAVLDEGGQALTATRAGRAADVVLDVAGAGLALALARWRPARLVPALTTTALVVAAAGGAVALTLQAFAGVPSGVLWVTTPAAALLLLARRRRRRA